MNRREFITLLGGAAATWPLAAHAQRPARAARIGCLVTGSVDSHGRFIDAFREGLGQLGHVEGHDYVLDVRWAEGRVDRLPMLAGELARLALDVAVTATSSAALAAKQAMLTIPIVCANLTDPIRLGLVASHNRPGGNVTGIMLTLDGLLGKQLQLVRELMPGASRIGMLVNMRNPSNAAQRSDAEVAAPALRIDIVPVDVRSSDDIDSAFQMLTRERSEFVLVLSDLIFTTERRRIAAVALAARLPTMYGIREHAEVGGVVSYGVALRENWRRSAYFVDKILKGTKPADLPVELPAKLELVINLKTAKALGLEIPDKLLALADEVIE
jgi:putative tryptophan/tyrosine transport system substrate-binding protein